MTDANINNLYIDALQCIAKYLDPWDLVSMSITCKAWYRLSRKDNIRKKISYPFLPKYKLTREQFTTLAQLMQPEAQAYKWKMVNGEVGSGKTWLAIGYMMRKYGEFLECNLTRQPLMHAIISVPPTMVGQWSDFLMKYTKIPVVSNYESSCFYMSEWEEQIQKFGLVVCSHQTIYRIVSKLDEIEREYVIFHDEAHNSIQNEGNNWIEIVGFTASYEALVRRGNQSVNNRSWKVYNMSAETLNQDIPDIQYKTYELPKYNKYELKRLGVFFKSSNINIGDYYGAMTELMFPIESRKLTFEVKKGKKTIYSRRKRWLDDMPTNHLKTLLEQMNNNPKLQQVAAVAKKVKDAGEKLVIFDINQDFVLLMYEFLKQYGIKPVPFCTNFDPKARAKLLEEFKTTEDVIIGSIDMLSEGHNLTEGNHILFLRYPTDPEIFMQAFGRCRRFPQKKTVWVHMIVSCQLELVMAMKGMERKFDKIRRRHYLELFEPFFDFPFSQSILPKVTATETPNDEESDSTEE